MINRRRFLAAAVATLAALSVAPPGASAQSDPEEPSPPPPTDVVSPPDETSVPGEEASPPPGVPPVTLAIPKLGVEAKVVGVTQEEDGVMASPENPDEVAWYSLGPGMGVGGNAVFAGHIDWGGIPRVFGRLSALEPGDVVLVVDAAGNGYQYAVESSRWVRAEGAPVEEIFAQTSAPTITLITCGGEYRAATREYLDRLIVHARGML